MACRPECAHIKTFLEYWSTIDVYARPPPAKLTGIVGTMGPASNDAEVLEKMIRAGMDIVRISLHQEPEEFQQAVNVVNEVWEKLSSETGVSQIVGIAMDLQGRQIKYGNFDNQENAVKLRRGETFTLTTNLELWDKGDDKQVAISYTELGQVVKPGTRIYLDYGTVCLKVTGAGGDVTGIVENDGVIRSNGTVNLPVSNVDPPYLSERDIENISYGLSHNADIIFASFIKEPEDISCIKGIFGERGVSLRIYASIDSREALMNFDQLIEMANGVIIGRGNLGIEIPPYKLCSVQKVLMAKALLAKKPALVFGGILESMVSKPRPTRAELTDIFNACLTGAGAIIFDAVTSFGEYPYQAIAIASNICREAEAAMFTGNLLTELITLAPNGLSIPATIAASICEAAGNVRATAIIALTTSGRTVVDIASYFPCCPVLAVTRNVRTARAVTLHRGVTALWYKFEILPNWVDDVRYRLEYGLKTAECEKYITTGDMVILAYGSKPGSGHTNTCRVLQFSLENVLESNI